MGWWSTQTLQTGNFDQEDNLCVKVFERLCSHSTCLVTRKSTAQLGEKMPNHVARDYRAIWTVTLVRKGKSRKPDKNNNKKILTLLSLAEDPSRKFAYTPPPTPYYCHCVVFGGGGLGRRVAVDIWMFRWMVLVQWRCWERCDRGTLEGLNILRRGWWWSSLLHITWYQYQPILSQNY